MKTIPELQVGYYVAFAGAAAEAKTLTGRYFQVVRTEPLVYVTNEGDETEFSSVADGGDSGWTDIEALEPKANRLYFVKPGVKDGCDYYIRIPSGTDRWGVDEDTDVGHFDNELSPHYAPSDIYAMWLVDDMYPSYKAENNTGHSLTPKVWHQGVKFDFAEVTEKPERFTTITLGGIKS